jgi:hypothetical protein
MGFRDSVAAWRARRGAGASIPDQVCVGVVPESVKVLPATGMNCQL